MGNFLITGGAGFIGSNFIRYFLKQYPDYFVVNLDKLTYSGNLENLRDIEDCENYTFIKGSICNTELLDFIFSKYGIDRVINFAAESHVDRSILGPEVFVETNVMGAQALLAISHKHKVERFIQISTDEVYGHLGDTGYFTEETPLAPRSPYSASKASADMFCRAYFETLGLPVLITRCSNNYGPYQFPEKLIPLMIHNASRGEKLPVYGDGTNVRDWIHVIDHCKGIDKVLHKGKPGEVYNIGANDERQNIEVVKLIIKALNKSDDLIQFVKDRPGHDRRYALDASRIRKELGWAPEYSFEEGLRETIDWYINNAGWIKRCISGEYRDYYKRNYEDRGF